MAETYYISCDVARQDVGSEELAGAPQEEDRTGFEAQLEELLGLSQGHHATLLHL